MEKADNLLEEVGVDKVLVENNSPYVHGCTTINLK